MRGAIGQEGQLWRSRRDDAVVRSGAGLDEQSLNLFIAAGTIFEQQGSGEIVTFEAKDGNTLFLLCLPLRIGDAVGS